MLNNIENPAKSAIEELQWNVQRISEEFRVSTSAVDRWLNQPETIPVAIKTRLKKLISLQRARVKKKLNSLKETQAGLSLNPEEVKSLRLQIGISQSLLAKRLGVSSSAIGHWENGRSYPNSIILHQMRKMAEQAEQNRSSLSFMDASISEDKRLIAGNGDGQVPMDTNLMLNQHRLSLSMIPLNITGLIFHSDTTLSLYDIHRKTAYQVTLTPFVRNLLKTYLCQPSDTDKNAPS